MKTHWISEISHARTSRRHHTTGSWYTYAKRQANRQVRRNAQLDINEGLNEVYFGPEDERAFTDWERGEQSRLMDEFQHILRAALNFTCRPVLYWDGDYEYADCCSWYNADGICVAYSEWTGIEVIPKHHAFVWDVFKLFL